MLRRSLASAALRPLTAVAHGRHSCPRRLSTATGDVSIALPKFLVTTVKTEQVGDKVTYNSSSLESSELPVFLVDVKYEDEASHAAEWVKTNDTGKGKKWTGDKGLGEFSGTVVSQADFTALLAKEGKEVVFFIHGFDNETNYMVASTDNLQTNFDLKEPDKVLVVPVDWACEADPDGPLGFELFAKKDRYHEDQTSSEVAGSALWKLFSGLKKNSKQTLSLNVIAHSMGNRVLRCMGKSAVPAGDASWTKKGLKDTSLQKAAPKDLQSNENLFENIFFVAADIPESVFEEPDGPHVEQAEHALQSGVAALAVMTKRMHVLHGDGGDQALNASWVLNKEKWKGMARLGARGPWSGSTWGGPPKPFGGEPTKVWDKINDALESNVHVKNCSGWNTEAALNGHSYQYAPESVDYYLKHMTKGK